MADQTKPRIMIPTEVEVIAAANRWLHQEIGTALHVTTATFGPVSYDRRLPLELAYSDKGILGVIGLRKVIERKRRRRRWGRCTTSRKLTSEA